MRKITVALEDTLWRRFRIACLERDVTAAAVLAELVTQQLAAWQTEARPPQAPARRAARDLKKTTPVRHQR